MPTKQGRDLPAPSKEEWVYALGLVTVEGPNVVGTTLMTGDVSHLQWEGAVSPFQVHGPHVVARDAACVERLRGLLYPSRQPAIGLTLRFRGRVWSWGRDSDG